MTASRIVFRPEANAEALEALRWYDERRPGLGKEFAEETSETIVRIAESPLAFPRVHGDTRRAILRRFPYGVYFRVLPDEIVVLAVMHGRRHASRWRSRR